MYNCYFTLIEFIFRCSALT